MGSRGGGSDSDSEIADWDARDTMCSHTRKVVTGPAPNLWLCHTKI